jgi:methylated-DNA-protein-cysteine methyltransferase related protein
MQIKPRLIELINMVPKGRLVSYGQLARLLGISAQMVGWTLSGMKQSEWSALPWQRVVAKDGAISALKLGQKGILQMDLLTQEGVEITDETVKMSKYGFDIEHAVLNPNTLL